MLAITPPKRRRPPPAPRSDLTIGQVAQLCQIATRTAQKWCDSGRLACYRLPQVSLVGMPTRQAHRERRIPRDALLQFRRAESLPIPHQLRRGRCVLLAWTAGLLTQQLEERLGPNVQTRWVTSWVDVGVLLASWQPDRLLVDLGMGRDEAVNALVVAERQQAQGAAVVPDDMQPDEALAFGFSRAWHSEQVEEMVAWLGEGRR